MANRPPDSSRLTEAIQGIAVHDHLCAIYETPEEALEQATTFVRVGLERGERCVFIAAEDTKSKLDAMRARGIEVEQAIKGGSLHLIPGQEMASKLGEFHPHRLIGFWQDTVQAATAAGYRTLRIVDDMRWVLDIGATPQRLLQYEARLNPFLRNHPALAICLYDRTQFTAQMLLNAVRTHPKVVYGWTVCKNPYYIPPEELLQPEDSERRLQRLLTYIEIHERIEESLHQLSARLLRLQDEERRNIARQLHETVAQTLVALKMNLAKASRSKPAKDKSSRALLQESIKLADESMQEIRTVSYLLHPPLLDEAGLLPALRWYVEGFSERSGIKVELDVPQGLERLPKQVETAVFRIIQECLTNVHRHAKSATAKIRIWRQDDSLRVEVEDCGVGMAATTGEEPGHAPVFGVGLTGIRERAMELGGRLEIDTSSRGTKVSVILPVPPASLWQKHAS